ncbi:MAG TPA: HtaA domain-containing protein, partial [Solirubrobacterales bacterium]|nr:HtaA domain-containing protein [Solirubrobacterales bacterium]
MSSLANPPVRRRRLRALLALAGAALASTALATSAAAAPATGDVVLTLKKGAKSSLLRDGVKVSPRSGKGATQKVTLKVTDADAASKLVKTGATLTFRANGKSVKVSGVELKAGAQSTAISGVQGGKRKVFFRLQGESLAVGNALSAKGPLALTGAGAKALGTALGIDGIKSGKIGSAGFSAVITTTPAPEPPKKEEKEPPKNPYPYEAQCPVAAVEGNPGFGEAPGKIESTLPLPVFNPDFSREVTGGGSDWGFKDSFRSYVLLVPPSGSLQALEGATANPAGPTMGIPGSFWSFPTSEGDYEPGVEGDLSDDKLVIDGEGTILFCKSGHGFNVVLKNPTVVIDGANSRIVADVGANFNGTWYPLQRADIATLDLDAVEPELTDGNTLAIWEDLPVELTADGEKALGGIYEAGEELDPITVEASLGPEPPEPYPYGTECPVGAVEGGMGDDPGVVDGIAPAPAFNAGTSQKLTGTANNWGFKSGFRGYVLGAPPAGTLQTLDGATASAAGMGMAVPTAYFGFPTGGGTYEPGTQPDHSDDKLVSNSTGTVLFCKPGHGFNVVLKNPTVTIDGDKSRVTADVGVNLSGKWFPFQRVDIATLDLDGVEPEFTESGNKVAWKEVPATLTEDGETALGGIYPAGEALDKITVETALERPLLTECTIAS